MLKFTSTTPSNGELGKIIERTEGIIRGIKKKDAERYNKLVLDYKMKYNPFVKLDEYESYLRNNNEYDEEEFKKFKKVIKSNKIPHTIYIDGRGNKNKYIPTIIEPYMQLKDILNDLSPYPITFAIGNHKGGATKTTTTTNIASALAYLGFKVLIVDFDHQGNTSGSFGLYADNYEHTIIDLIEQCNEKNIEELVRKAIINIELSDKFQDGIMGKLDVIPNNATMSEKVEDLPTMSRKLGTIENTLETVLSYVKNDYDFIFIDLPPRTDIILRAAMMASDYFILSLNPQPFAKMGVPYILNPIEKFRNVYKKEKGKDYKILGGIVGFYEKGITVQDINYEQIKNDIIDCTNGETSLFETYIPKNTYIQESQQGDGALLFNNPTEKTVKNIFDISIELLERVTINLTENE